MDSREQKKNGWRNEITSLHHTWVQLAGTMDANGIVGNKDSAFCDPVAIYDGSSQAA